MNVKITSANCEVINSGLVTSFNNEPICITVPTNDGNPLKIVFQFFIDESTESSKIETEVPNSSEIILKLTNFNSPLGTGTSSPISFATENSGKKLYLNFYVYVIGKASPTLQYTIYKEM